MDYKTADGYRTFFTKMFQRDKNQYYFCAIVQSAPSYYPDDFSVVFYGCSRMSSFLLPLANLAQAIEEIDISLRASFCEYDAGTTEEDMRVAVVLNSLKPHEAR